MKGGACHTASFVSIIRSTLCSDRQVFENVFRYLDRTSTCGMKCAANQSRSNPHCNIEGPDSDVKLHGAIGIPKCRPLAPTYFPFLHVVLDSDEVLIPLILRRFVSTPATTFLLAQASLVFRPFPCGPTTSFRLRCTYSHIPHRTSSCFSNWK
jgi:hypothetical protein